MAAGSATDIYTSGSCSVPTAGWMDLASGAKITKLPYWDSDKGIFCRQGPLGSAQTLAAQGYRLPTWQEMEELHKASLFIDPYTMPDVAILEAAGISRNNYQAGGAGDAAYQRDVDAFRNAHMSSFDWDFAHDTEVFKRLAKAGWKGEPVANAGKHWIADGGIYGWWKRDGSLIQGLSYAHKGTNHVDYGTTFHAVSGKGASPSTPPGSIYPPGMGGSRIAGALAGLGLSGLCGLGVWWLGR